MLRRDRQRWTTVYQLKDAALFMLALWLAHLLRTNLPLDFLERPGIGSFGPYAWLSMIIIPGAPLILELQGFYKRPLFCSRRTTAWLLAKSCLFVGGSTSKTSSAAPAILLFFNASKRAFSSIISPLEVLTR